MKTLIRRAILAWQCWRVRRAIDRAYPELASLSRQLEINRRRHKPVKHIERQMRELMTDALRGSL